MTDSVRQQIMSALDTRLKGILKSGGYQTDIGLNVHDWQAEATGEDDLPVLIYRDPSVENQVFNFACFGHMMTVNVSVAVSGSTPMTEVRKMIADIDKAVGVDDTWGGLALMTDRIGDESEVEIGGKKFSGCTIKFVVTFRTVGWDDYQKV